MGVPISNVTRRVVYTASGTGPYNFTFEILAAGDVAVYRDDTLLTITTDYTVTINANGTGFITLVASPTGATQIAIVGNRTIQRTTDFVTGGDFFANTVNDEMDQQTIFAQQNAEGLQRAMQAPQTDPTNINMTLPRAALRAGKTLAFDAQGNPSLGDTLGTNRGNWAAGTLYYVRDIVKDTTTSNVWQCLVQHTSSGSQPISTNTDAAKWFLLVDAAAAGASATAAAASASAAATSASNASTSASNAASSASTAATQASNASTSATNAANSATAAASSASTASTAATNAGNSATAAATSATNASNSASSAITSASNASTSATSAANSATTATTQATNASNSASSASTSASNASTSATNAANSASSASTSATNASNSATAAAGSATSAAASAAAAAASLDNFDDRYLGPKSSNPTVDNDGNALLTGALYYRTTAPIGMKVYDGNQWIEASAAQQASLVTFEYTATAGQTTFTGNDANGVTLSYTVGNVMVAINGVLQNPGDDFTATNGTSIVLTVGAALNDEIVVLAFRTFEVANTYTQAQADARFVNVDGDTMTGNLAITNASPSYQVQATGGNAYRFRADTNDAFIRSATAGVDVMQFEYGGRVTLPQGQLRFPASQNASSDANTLDDYEEGTWTPTVRGGSTAGTTTYTSFREGSYVKIGRQVTANCRVSYSAATGTGFMLIAGLPFQAINQSFAGSVMVDGFNWPASGSIVAYVANSTDLTFWVSGDDAAWSISSISNEAADFIVNITYFV